MRAAAIAPRSAYTPEEQAVQSADRVNRHGARATSAGRRVAGIEVEVRSEPMEPGEEMNVDAHETYTRKLEDLREEAVIHKARQVLAKDARGEPLTSFDEDYFVMTTGEDGLTRMQFRQLMGGANLPPLSNVTYEDIRGDDLGKNLGKKLFGKRQRNALEFAKNYKNGVFVAPKGRLSAKAAPKRARLEKVPNMQGLMQLLAVREEEAAMERRTGSLVNELSNFELFRSFACQLGRSPYFFDLAYAPSAKQIADYDGFMKLFVLFGSLHYTSHQSLLNTVSAVRTVNMRIAGVVLPPFPRTTAALKEVRAIMYNEAGERRERHGIMPQHFTAIAADWTATIKAARGGTKAQQSHAAFLANCLTLLAACKSKAFRPGEISPKVWDAVAYWSRHSVEVLRGLVDGAAECIKPPLALKNMHGADGVRRSVLARPWPYVYVKSDPCCLPAAIKLMAEADPIAPGRAKTTPVVRNPVTGGPLDVTLWGRTLQEAHHRLFPDEPTISVSAYSIKIGATLALKFVGATAAQRQLFAGWADDAIMGVYDDDERDEIVRLMTRASTQSFVSLAAAVGSSASAPAPPAVTAGRGADADELTEALRQGWCKRQRRANEEAQAEGLATRQRARTADPTNPRWAAPNTSRQQSLVSAFGRGAARSAGPTEITGSTSVMVADSDNEDEQGGFCMGTSSQSSVEVGESDDGGASDHVSNSEEEGEQRQESEVSSEGSGPDSPDSAPEAHVQIQTRPLLPRRTVGSGRMRLRTGQSEVGLGGGIVRIMGAAGAAAGQQPPPQRASSRADPGVRPRLSQDDQEPPSTQAECEEVVAIASEAAKSDGYEARRDARMAEQSARELEAFEAMEEEKRKRGFRRQMDKRGWSSSAAGRSGKGGRKLRSSSDSDSD